MRKRLRIQWLLAVVAMAGSAFWGGQNAFAQSDDPSLVWTAKKPVTRVEKPYHKPKPKPPKPKPHVKPKPVVVQAPLLSLRWSLRTPDADGKAKTVHPDHVFKVGNKVQLVVEVNQSGYLYIVQEDDMSMIFPYPKFNDNKNAVAKGNPLIIPSNCPAKNTDKFGNCYFDVNDSGSAITIIFSRDKLQGLPDEIDESKGVVPISRDDLKKIRGNVQQDYRKKDIKGTDVVQYWNNNPKDNEDLIIDTKINYEKPERNN